MPATYVISFACRTQEEESLYLATPEFFSSWKAARTAAFQRLLDNIDTDISAPDPDLPTLEHLEAMFPEDRPEDFDYAYSNAEGAWIIGVTDIP